MEVGKEVSQTVMTVYEIIHVLPNKTRQLLHTLTDPTEIPLLVETEQFAGTWLTESRKLLRYGRGELIVSKLDKPMEVAHKAFINTDGQMSCVMKVKNGGPIGWFEVTVDEIIAYSVEHKKIWSVTSFTELAEILGEDQKLVAYQCKENYEGMLDEFEMEGAL